MLKKLLFLIVFNCFQHFSYSQHGDSLQQLLVSANSNYLLQKKLTHEFVDHSLFKNFEQTISICDLAIKLSEKNKDSSFTGELIRAKGTAEYFAGNFDKAANDFYQSIQILALADDKTQLAHTYNALAKLYRKTRDLDLSMENYDKALFIFKSLNDSAGISMILNESGVVFEYREEYEKALERYNASLEIAKIKKDSVGISYALSFIAGVYVIQKRFTEAEQFLLTSLKMRERTSDSFTIALNFTDLGQAMSASGNYPKSLEYFKRSNKIAQELKYPELLASNYAALSDIAENQHDFQNAFYFYRLKSQIDDSLFNIDKTKQIEDLSAKYQAQKKERQIQTQKEEIKRKNLIISGGIFILLLSLLLSISFYRRRKLKQRARFQQQLLQQQRQSALAVMEAEEKERQRIASDLHDGVGQMMSAAKMNLSAFENKMDFVSEEHRDSFKKIISLVDDSCKEVRSVSHNMMPNALLRNNLESAIRELVDQIDNRVIKVHLFTEGLGHKLDSNVELVLYRIIQECVNNVIKHAKATSLDISVVKDESEISVTIEDDGIGFDTSNNDAMGGLGMQNIKARVDFLNGSVEFNSVAKKGTLVTVNVPLIQSS